MRLSDAEYFASLDEGTLGRLDAAAQPIDFPAGLVMTEPGQVGSGLFLIVEGTAVVEPPEGPKELGPGEVFGEIALLEPRGRRTARVRAQTDVRCLVVDRATLEREGLAGAG